MGQGFYIYIYIYFYSRFLYLKLNVFMEDKWKTADYTSKICLNNKNIVCILRPFPFFGYFSTRRPFNLYIFHIAMRDCGIYFLGNTHILTRKKCEQSDLTESLFNQIISGGSFKSTWFCDYMIIVSTPKVISS